MKEFPLTQGMVALIDDADYEKLMALGKKWSASCQNGKWYAVSAFRTNGRHRNEFLHRYLMGAEHKDGTQVDHVDGNGLNNQRSNLRRCTRQQNLQNRPKVTNRWPYKGVYRGCKKGVPYGRWWAKIVIARKDIRFGPFDTAEEAARAYDKAAVHYFGEFAHTNFKAQQIGG